MIKRICDGCGCEIERIHEPYNLRYKVERNDHDRITRYDFCRDCTEKLNSFIERMTVKSGT